MQLLFKRAKIFMLEKDGKNLRFMIGPGGPVPVPAWVAETGTYKHGMEDGSIVNLTEKARQQEEVLAKEEHRKPEAIIDPAVPEDEQGDEPAQHAPQGTVTASTTVKTAQPRPAKVNKE